MIIRLFSVFLVVLSFISLAYAASNDQKKIQDTQAAAKYFEDKLNFTAVPGTVKKVSEGKVEGVIIDLRKKEHFDKGHIPGAINIPFDKFDGFEGAQTEFPGLSKDKIHFELFTTGLTEDDKQRINKIVEKKVEGTEVTIIDGGKEFHFVMGEDFDNILDGAIAAGADLPYACKGGVCSTCRCKVVDGSVEMKLNYSLEADELAKNYVLSCQAVPTSKKVVVDFGL